MLLAYALSEAITQILKREAEQPRPTASIAGLDVHGYPTEPHGHAYPSAHTSVAVGVGLHRRGGGAEGGHLGGQRLAGVLLGVVGLVGAAAGVEGGRVELEFREVVDLGDEVDERHGPRCPAGVEPLG